MKDLKDLSLPLIVNEAKVPELIGKAAEEIYQLILEFNDKDDLEFYIWLKLNEFVRELTD